LKFTNLALNKTKIITLFQERLPSTDLHFMLILFHLSNDGCIQYVHLSTLGVV